MIDSDAGVVLALALCALARVVVIVIAWRTRPRVTRPVPVALRAAGWRAP